MSPVTSNAASGEGSPTQDATSRSSRPSSSAVRGPRSGPPPRSRRTSSRSSRTCCFRRAMMAAGSTSSLMLTCGGQPTVKHTHARSSGDATSHTFEDPQRQGRHTADWVVACIYGYKHRYRYRAAAQHTTHRTNMSTADDVKHKQQRAATAPRPKKPLLHPAHPAHRVGDQCHALCKAAGGDGLLQLSIRGVDGGHHDGAAVAAQGVAQDLSHEGVAVGHVCPVEGGRGRGTRRERGKRQWVPSGMRAVKGTRRIRACAPCQRI
jgi:hypothetical protein